MSCNLDKATLITGTVVNGVAVPLNSTALTGRWDDQCDVQESPFSSIPATFWWCIVTLMTVGYGDVVPVTAAGKVVAVLTMIQAVLLLSLPISVIGTEFTQQWLEFKSAAASVEKGRLAPRFVALRKSLHAHNVVLDDILLRVRDSMFEMEEISLRLADKLSLKKMELNHVAQLHKRKATAVVDADGGDDRLGSLVQSRMQERRRLQNSSEIVFLEAELRKRHAVLKELLAQIEMLRNNSLVKRLESCRSWYYNLRRLWQTMQLLDSDARPPPRPRARGAGRPRGVLRHVGPPHERSLPVVNCRLTSWSSSWRSRCAWRSRLRRGAARGTRMATPQRGRRRRRAHRERGAG